MTTGGGNDNFVGDAVDRFLSIQPLPRSEPHGCPYLPNEVAQSEGFTITDLPGEVHRALLDRGFRRSGQVVYRPRCPNCRACRQIRVPVSGFAPSRSQRRVWRRNRDVRVSQSTTPAPTDEKWHLFRAYLAYQHDGTMPDSYDSFLDFLYAPVTESSEFCYRLGDQLVGVSLADRCADALSSVYMFFDPAHRRRSLGTFSILWEIDYCRRRGLAFYYLGFHVAGAKTMSYKARFRPCEILDGTFAWRRVGKETHQ